MNETRYKRELGSNIPYDRDVYIILFNKRMESLVMKTKCPYCDYIATEHETLEMETGPKVGDISFCIGCGEPSQYIEKGLVKIDMEKLHPDNRKEIQDMRIAWLKVRARMSVKQ